MSVRDSMVDEGPFGSTRLCHMKEIIMVYQVMSGTMLTVAKTLDVPHGHYDARGEMPSTSVPVKKLFVSLSDSLQSWNLLGADTSVQCSFVDNFDLNVWDFVNEILTEKKIAANYYWETATYFFGLWVLWWTMLRTDSIR